MKSLSTICALGILSFGLGAAATAQTNSGASMDRPATSKQRLENPRQDEFKHPMLEQQRSNEMRATEGDRIQRRGSMQETRTDGDIQRNALPGAADNREGNVTDRRAGGKPADSSKQP